MSRSRINNLEDKAWSQPDVVAVKLPIYLVEQLHHLEKLYENGAKEKYQRPVRASIFRGIKAWYDTNRARGIKDHTIVLP